MRFLKAGVTVDGKLKPTAEGTPRGGLCSPILANVYLHYVIDLWFEKVVRKVCRGDAYIVRYADDFVCCFQYEEEAKKFYQALIGRLKRFNLEIAEDKTKIAGFEQGRQHFVNHQNPPLLKTYLRQRYIFSFHP